MYPKQISIAIKGIRDAQNSDDSKILTTFCIHSQIGNFDDFLCNNLKSCESDDFVID